MDTSLYGSGAFKNPGIGLLSGALKERQKIIRGMADQDPLNYWQQYTNSANPWVKLEAKNRVAELTKPSPYNQLGGMNAVGQSFQDYLSEYQRKMQEYVKKYKAQVAQNVAATRAAMTAAISPQQRALQEQMFANLSGRGLEDSESFRAGAQNDLSLWNLQQQQNIRDTVYNMRQRAQENMLSAIGRPDYASLYAAWNQANQRQNAYNYDVWARENPRQGFGPGYK